MATTVNARGSVDETAFDMKMKFALIGDSGKDMCSNIDCDY